MTSGTIVSPAASADAKAPAVEKPPANNPLESAWDVFERTALPRTMDPTRRREIKHGFYAGARAAFYGVIDAMTEQDEGHPDGEKRFANIEKQISAYWAQVVAAGMIAMRAKR